MAPFLTDQCEDKRFGELVGDVLDGASPGWPINLTLKQSVYSEDGDGGEETISRANIREFFFERNTVPFQQPEEALIDQTVKLFFSPNQSVQ